MRTKLSHKDFETDAEGLENITDVLNLVWRIYNKHLLNGSIDNNADHENFNVNNGTGFTLIHTASVSFPHFLRTVPNHHSNKPSVLFVVIESLYNKFYQTANSGPKMYGPISSATILNEGMVLNTVYIKDIYLQLEILVWKMKITVFVSLI